MGRRKQHSRKRPPPPPAAPAALTRARTLWRDGRIEAALSCFEQAVREAPRQPVVLIDASRALAVAYQSHRSRELLAQAARLCPDDGSLQWEIAQTYQMLGDWQAAEASLRHTLRCSKAPAAQLALAQICERRHQLAEADALVEAYLHHAPDEPRGRLLRARVHRRQGAPELAERVLRQLAGERHQRPEHQAEAWGDLAELLDAQAAYGDAWEAALKCKSLLLPAQGPVWKTAQRALRRMQQFYASLESNDLRPESPDESLQDAPVALLTGFPRCGTTLIQQVLASSPEVVVVEERDVFGGEIVPCLPGAAADGRTLLSSLRSLSPGAHQALQTRYLNMMTSCAGQPLQGKLLLDKNPGATLMIPIMRRIFPGLRVLVARRDSRDIVVSCFLRYLPLNPVSVCFLTLERCVWRYRQDQQGWQQLREMLPGPWAEIHYERLVQDLSAVMREASAAIGVAWSQPMSDHRRAASRQAIASPSYADVAEDVYQRAVGRWRHYEDQLAPVLAELTRLAEEASPL